MCQTVEELCDGDHTVAPLSADVIAPIHFQELSSMRDILPPLLRTFRTSASQSIDLIRSAIVANDPVGLATSAHGLTGAAGSLGGQRLVSLCRDLERKGSSGTVEGALGVLPFVLEECAMLCEALEGICAEHMETSCGKP